jgi:hypothetical protein
MQAAPGTVSPGLRKPLAGAAAALIALLLWSGRDRVPAWFAASYTASIEITTTTETDDARL